MMDNYKDLIERLNHYGLTNGASLGRHIGIMDEAADAIAALTKENAQLRGELEQVKRSFGRICEYIDSEGYLRKQFCENGDPDLEPCVCPSLKKHCGYVDSDDCEDCDLFRNSWRGPQKEE